MVVNNRPSKRLKRGATTNLYDFMTFPAAADSLSAEGPFRSNVCTFLKKYGRAVFAPTLFPLLLTWQIMFRVGDQVAGDATDSSPELITLEVVEEDVPRSRSVYCNQCRVVGWSGHPVCRKRYHFIIRAQSDQLEAYQKPCTRCGSVMHLLDSKCRSCNNEIVVDDFEDWMYIQLEDTTHLLHGVVHSNGYGHLLTVNGREGGSEVLSGCRIMNFWDRLCKALAVRRVSVMDASRKFGLEYRLLHAISKGHSWYGEWGYEFGAGSYALTLQDYKKAIETLSTMHLTPLLYQSRRPRTPLQSLIAFYQSLSNSQLQTFKDLFSFLLNLIHETRNPSIKSQPIPSNALCTWTRHDVERVERTMVKVLQAAVGEGGWVTRRALKGAVYKAASPELLDYCLEHLGGKLLANGMVVQSRCNSTSKVVEFRLEPPVDRASPQLIYPSEVHVIHDLKFLYDSILHPQTILRNIPQATREIIIDSATKILNCKQFVKVYMPHNVAVTNPSAIFVWCHVELEDYPKGEPAPPPELVILPYTGTVANLKVEAAKTFQEVYPIFKRFQAKEVIGYGDVKDDMTLNMLIGSSGSLRLKVKCPGTRALSHFRTERGTENWTVLCICGARDDDGEKMLACDACGVWMHTRCERIIDSSDVIPAKFVCTRCRISYSEESERTFSTQKTNEIPNGRCREEAVATNGTRLAPGIPMCCDVS